MPKKHQTIKTPHGNFQKTRKDAIAITIVKARRKARQHRKKLQPGDLSHIEHRKTPTHQHKISLGGWATYIATYDLKGTQIQLKD